MLKAKLPRRKKLNWGIAGLGNFAEHTFLPTLNLVTRAKLISVYSRDINRAKNFLQNSPAQKCFDNYKDFLNSGIDAVYISSSNSDHYEQVIAAAKAGKHILCEKPLAVNSVQAREMVEVCKANKVFLTVNYVYRYHPFVQKVREMIENQLLGKFIYINANFNAHLVPGDNFRYSREKAGGGAVRDLGTHIIDLYRFLGGEISEISGYTDNIVYKAEVEDFALATMKFQNGAYGNFTVSYNSKKAFNEIQILFHKGSVKLENMIGKRFESAKLRIVIDGERPKVFRKRANRLYRLIREVNNDFMNNRQPAITGEDGLINMELMEKLENKWTI
jgi:predicted dehydrogenase